jgi:ketosteroid isomerase-like protein
VVINKAEILQGLDRLKPTDESKSVYSAEDIVTHDYGDTAVVAFRLVARTEYKNGKAEIDHYRNTGTFLNRNGTWQVIAWQSTKVPEKTATATPPHH